MYSCCSLIPVQEVRLIHEDTTGLRMTNLSMELLIAESENLSKLKILELVKPREITVFFLLSRATTKFSIFHKFRRSAVRNSVHKSNRGVFSDIFLQRRMFPELVRWFKHILRADILRVSEQ